MQTGIRPNLPARIHAKPNGLRSHGASLRSASVAPLRLTALAAEPGDADRIHLDAMYEQMSTMQAKIEAWREGSSEQGAGDLLQSIRTDMASLQAPGTSNSRSLNYMQILSREYAKNIGRPELGEAAFCTPEELRRFIDNSIMGEIKDFRSAYIWAKMQNWAAFNDAVLTTVEKFAAAQHDAPLEDSVRAIAYSTIYTEPMNREETHQLIVAALRNVENTETPHPKTLKSLFGIANLPKVEGYKPPKKTLDAIYALVLRLPLDQQVSPLRSYIRAVVDNYGEIGKEDRVGFNAVTDHVIAQVPQLSAHAHAPKLTKDWANLMRTIIAHQLRHETWTQGQRHAMEQAIATLPQEYRDRLEYYFVGQLDDRKARAVVQRLANNHHADHRAGRRPHVSVPGIIKYVSPSIEAFTLECLLRLLDGSKGLEPSAWQSTISAGLLNKRSIDTPVKRAKREKKLTDIVQRRFPPEDRDVLTRQLRSDRMVNLTWHEPFDINLSEL